MLLMPLRCYVASRPHRMGLHHLVPIRYFPLLCPMRTEPRTIAVWNLDGGFALTLQLDLSDNMPLKLRLIYSDGKTADSCEIPFDDLRSKVHSCIQNEIAELNREWIALDGLKMPLDEVDWQEPRLLPEPSVIGFATN